MKTSDQYLDFIESLKKGQICVFETDTVVGIGCLINVNGKVNPNIDRIFDIKKRPKDKPLPWLVSSNNMLIDYVSTVPGYANELIENNWPGDTTLIFNVNNITSKTYLSDSEIKDSVAFRVPNVEDLVSAIDYVSYPVACTSANFSGESPVRKVSELSPEFLELVDFVYTKTLKSNNINKASKIISCTEQKPFVIRS